MELETLPVVVLITGMVLLYGAVKNRNPLDVLQLALQGKDLAEARTISKPVASFGEQGSGSAPNTGPLAPDASGMPGLVDGLLGLIGVDGNTVVIPYKGHPLGSKATDMDVPGFMGGVEGKNSSYREDDPRYHGTQTKPAINVAPQPQIPFRNYA